jgi:hypothetical protein
MTCLCGAVTEECPTATCSSNPEDAVVAVVESAGAADESECVHQRPGFPALQKDWQIEDVDQRSMG